MRSQRRLKIRTKSKLVSYAEWWKLTIQSSHRNHSNNRNSLSCTNCLPNHRETIIHHRRIDLHRIWATITSTVPTMMWDVHNPDRKLRSLRKPTRQSSAARKTIYMPTTHHPARYLVVAAGRTWTEIHRNNHNHEHHYHDQAAPSARRCTHPGGDEPSQ